LKNFAAKLYAFVPSQRHLLIYYRPSSCTLLDELHKTLEHASDMIDEIGDKDEKE
jgi:hypothetical protein